MRGFLCFLVAGWKFNKSCSCKGHLALVVGSRGFTCIPIVE